GSHGRDGASRLLLGSVAETVVRRAPVPVTVVRDGEDGTTNPERILVPFDGSELSEAALEHTLERYPEADVTALYVVYPPRDVMNTQVDIGGSLEAGDGEDRVSETLAAATEVGESVGREVSTASVEGLPEEQIVAVVEDEEFDHVVMGSTGREGFERLLLGSVAETVVRRSPVSVTIAVSEVET
ncbi:MAG: universal stress protein, partial [Halovenus sp.]